MILSWKTHSKHFQTAAERIDVITSLSTKLPWPEDSKGTFLSLTQAATCLYRTWWRLRIVPYLVPHVKRKPANSIFLSLWFDPIGIELESTISVENVPSTRSLIDPYMYEAFFYTFRNQNDFYCLSAPQISNIFATFRYLNLCNRFCKLGKPVVRNRHGNFFRTVHLRTVIK